MALTQDAAQKDGRGILGLHCPSCINQRSVDEGEEIAVSSASVSPSTDTTAHNRPHPVPFLLRNRSPSQGKNKDQEKLGDKVGIPEPDTDGSKPGKPAAEAEGGDDRGDVQVTSGDDLEASPAPHHWLCGMRAGTAGTFGRQASFTDLDTLLEQTRRRMREPDYQTVSSNRYGTKTRLPPFLPEEHVPVLALINPSSGAEAGRDILNIAKLSPYYQDRFFNIVEVVKEQYRGGLLDVFRLELNQAKTDAKARGLRPRLISGGGDGTASFALFIVLSALRADDSRADEGLADTGNGFIWDDSDLELYFPALAQLPLGSSNDFGNTLGWGNKYPGDHRLRGKETAKNDLKDWILAVLDPASRLANFDIFGMMPAEGEEKVDFKVCDLSGPQGRDPKVWKDGQKQLAMAPAGTPVPMFVCLYFSAGFGAYMTARFQINRRKHPTSNKLEYVRQAVGILTEQVPPQLCKNLSAVSVRCAGDQYFPPVGKHGENYREVGFLNINWQAGLAHGADRAPLCGRICSSSRGPAQFNDGKMDMFRLKLRSPIKNPGFVYQVDKKGGTTTLTFDGEQGKGIFFQWDGEARFAFSPTGGKFHMNIRKILNIPVVLGPKYSTKLTGDPFTHDQVCFSFSGHTMQERADSRERTLRYVRGELNSELNATREEMISAGLVCEGDEASA
eukprot:CAMPEP_0206433260 /NCGR_PEP_ID=MMETSP0324_2-20121206/8428_1 /ASSEMBLY_ACC=CAM_ASM_000836 /TAXON_ID=2866 /ORGANISM="Crypthecodinium cohnii, Strain Seligo" /LENGTH=673 /DNA_ID=CAMNT_0053899493 /DNA_START=28 /DNA_END=2049 /DNA_ORIENTATION=-